MQTPTTYYARTTAARHELNSRAMAALQCLVALTWGSPTRLSLSETGL